MRPDAEFYRALGAYIRDVRLRKKISLDDMVELLDGKYGKSTLGRYERGDENIQRGLNDICQVLGIDPEQVWSDVEMQLTEEKMIDESTESAMCEKLETLHTYGYSDDTIKVADMYASLSNKDKEQARNFLNFLANTPK